VQQGVVAIRQIAQHHSLNPLMIVFGILVAAAAAKSGHAMWAVGGMPFILPGLFDDLRYRAKRPQLARPD
jgi:hypothetical protein